MMVKKTITVTENRRSLFFFHNRERLSGGKKKEKKNLILRDGRWGARGGHQGDKRSAPGVARLRIEDESWLASLRPSSNRKGCLSQPASTDDGSSWHRSRQSTDASCINSCWVNKRNYMLSAKVLIEITQQLTGKGNSVHLILITATEITPQNKIPVHGGKTNNSPLRDM